MISSVPTLFVSYLINSAWEVALLAGAGWMASRLLKRIGAQVEHIVWVFTLLLAVLMPAFPATRWLREFIPVPWAATEHLSSTLVAVQSSESIHDAVYVLPAAFSWPLLCLYLGSLFYFAIRLARSLRCTTLLRRHSRPLLLTPPQDEIWHDCKQSFCLKTVQILSSSHISGPVTF